MIWEESTPDHCRDLVRVYWRWRGLTLEPPPTIRSGLIWHPFERRTMPAMIAAIQNTEGRLQGVHVTCLRRDGRGKAQTERPRLIYGQMIGGAVRLAPAGRKLGLAEGIENAATVQQEAGLTCWAALSAGNLPKLELPATISEVVLCPDRGQAGESAAQAAADGYLAKGHEVRVAWPPGNFEDFNAALMAEACGEAA
jgi:hypothetical protein